MIKIKWLASLMGVKWVRESGYGFILLASLHSVTHWSSRVTPPGVRISISGTTMVKIQESLA